MGSIITGVIVIAVGLINGNSVFNGNAGLTDYIFDGLGVVLIGLGIYRMAMKAKT